VECLDKTDFIFPMKADVYYPIISQSEYGQAKKEWRYDRTIVCNATPVGSMSQEDLKPATFLQFENKLVTRIKEDIRISSENGSNAMSNILVTNIRSASDNIIYLETAGSRAGKGTIYEVGTLEPFINPFGSIEYFKVLLRRAENQTVGD